MRSSPVWFWFKFALFDFRKKKRMISDDDEDKINYTVSAEKSLYYYQGW